MIRLLSACLLCWTGVLVAGSVHYPFDAGHSSSSFAVRMLWLHQVNGRIGGVSGQLSVDDQQHARVSATIDVEQVHMDNPRYRNMLRSEDFFDTEHYPTIAFRSDAFAATLLNTGGDLSGHLTMRGLTRRVQFQLLPGHCRLADLAGCEIRVRGVVRRSRFDMQAYRFSLSDHVQLRLAITLGDSA